MNEVVKLGATVSFDAKTDMFLAVAVSDSDLIEFSASRNVPNSGYLFDGFDSGIDRYVVFIYRKNLPIRLTQLFTIKETTGQQLR